MSRYQPYPSYKDSSVEWLGEVPEHWVTTRIGNLFKRTKTTDCIDEELLSVYRDYGVIPKSSRDDNNNKPSDDLTPYQLVLPGNLVMNKMKAWQGSIAISNYRGIVSPAYFVYTAEETAKESISNEYLHHLLRSDLYIVQYLRYSKGIRINQWDLDPDSFKVLEVLLPPQSEQKLISDFINNEHAKIDILIAKQQRMIELLGEKRAAMISHAVTKGINPDVSMKDSGVEWLGEVPEHWEVKKLKYNLRLQTQKVTIDGHSVIALENIESKLGKYVSTESSYQGEDVEFKAGDILFGKLRPYLAKVYKCNSNGVAFGDLLTYRPTKYFDSSFAFYSLLSEAFIRIVDSSTYGAKMPRASSEFINEMLLTTPPLPEQIAIAGHLDIQTTKIDTLIAKARQAIELMKERRTALISAAVTGKIDVRGMA